MKKIIAIGDLHIGSMYAPLPPDFITYDGAVKTWNPAQEYLWKCWDDFAWRCHKFAPDAIIVNGDCIEGPQKKSNGFEVSLPSQDDQCAACVAILHHLKARVPETCKWYFTAGTAYHVGEWHSAEEGIARDMGGEAYWSIGTGRQCREVLWLDAEGVILEATHHPAGSSTGFYRMTVLDRDAQWSAMAAKDATKGIPKAELLIRSHLHFFGNLEHESKQVLQLPCWKLGDRHSRKSGLHRFIPSIGGVFIEVDGTAKSRGEAPCTVRKELYSLPPVKVVKL
jgi:hypothetical protein